MSVFDFDSSVRRALNRLSAEGDERKRRADRGRTRLAPAVLAEARELLSGQERPPVEDLLSELRRRCEARGHRAPARATLYQLMERLDVHTYRATELPDRVRGLLYNLAEDAEIPGRQLAVYCFNYGGVRELSFGASLPWIDLYQAARVRALRPRSRGLLAAVLRARRI
jgi:hypothetical protein